MAKRSAKREEFLKDILCIIIEGGVDYWAEIIETTREDDSSILGWTYTSVTLKSDDEPEVYTIDIDDVARGANLLSKSTINNQWVNDFRDANKTNGDEGDIDAMNCDMVAQYAIFGETVYG